MGRTQSDTYSSLFTKSDNVNLDETFDRKSALVHVLKYICKPSQHRGRAPSPSQHRGRARVVPEPASWACVSRLRASIAGVRASSPSQHRGQARRNSAKFRGGCRGSAKI